MKSIFDKSTREELINRINAVTQQSNARWGKMNVFQMLVHCTLCEDMFLGKTKINRVLIGRLFGKMISKQVLKDDAPFRRNSPTSPLLKTNAETGDIEQQKKEWISRIEKYADYTNPHLIHPFFGSMTKEQIGLLAYKHTDHHLRQFGA
jgi:hypothetical protein